jgi:proline iminopeptidase
MKHKIFFLTTLILSVVSTHAQKDTSIFSKFTAETVKIDGYKISIEVLGEGDPIFFFSGGPGSSHDYMQSNFGRYYSSHKVVFIDFLGRGFSDDAEDKDEYSIANDVYVIEEVRKHLKLAKISLVGHSYGTVPAQAYAVKYPDQVDKMLLISGFHSGEMWQNNCDNYNHEAKTHFPKLWETIDSLRALGYVSSDSVFMEAYSRFPIKYVYYHDTKVRGVYPKTKYRSFNVDVYYGMLGEDGDFLVGGDMIAYDVRRKLKDLKFPTMIMAGRYDGVSTPLYNLQYKDFMPQAQFVMFEQSGHNPYLEEKEKFYALFEEFFEIK